MTGSRTYRRFEHRGAAFNICCEAFEVVTAEIVRRRQVLEGYIAQHPAFGSSFAPLSVSDTAPEVVRRMARAAALVGVGPMAAVAGVMAQLAAEAGIAAGVHEAIVENGGDIFLVTVQPVVMGLYTGTPGLAGRLAFSIPACATPLAVCSSSGRMGHSTSLGDCDLATVVAEDAALADAAATRAANMVRMPDDIDATLSQIGSIEGVDGVVLVKGERIGLIGKLPELVRIAD